MASGAQTIGVTLMANALPSPVIDASSFRLSKPKYSLRLGGTPASSPPTLRPVVIAASPAEPAATAAAHSHKPLREVLSEAGRKALGGGIPGMAAMATQVLTLMWLRTTINYQYRYGTDMTTALKTLYGEGGVRRFYRGLLPALVQAPMSRFGDTAANAGTLSLLDSYDATRSLPLGAKTLVASAAAGCFRVLLMPVDTLKTIMQVEGKEALPALAAKVRSCGPAVLYHGALAASAAAFVGHYPWFATYNYLNSKLPPAPPGDLPRKLARSALLGFTSSAVADCCSNSIRVIKTAKQTSKEAVSYTQVARAIIEKDGVLGLMGRGLKTKILANGLQGICFTIVWRMGQDWWDKRHPAPTLAPASAPIAAATAEGTEEPTSVEATAAALCAPVPTAATAAATATGGAGAGAGKR